MTVALFTVSIIIIFFYHYSNYFLYVFQKLSKTSTNNNINNKINNNEVRNEYIRHTAAAKLAAAYRGRKVRKDLEYEKRKQDAIQRKQFDDEIEANLPRAVKLNRPKGKSYIGF